MCSNTWHHFLCGIKIEHQEWWNVTGILVSWQLYIHQSLIRCAIESMIWALGTQKIIHPFSSLRTPSDHITSPESYAEPRSPISQFKGPRPLGATTLAETNNLQIGCMCVLKPPQMICLYNVQLSDLLNKRGQKGQVIRSPLGREVTTYMVKNSPCLFFYSLNHNVYWPFNNRQNCPAEVSQNKQLGGVNKEWTVSADSIVYLHKLVCIRNTKGIMLTRCKHTHKISAKHNWQAVVLHRVLILRT